ncbi:thiamine ABC transporter ATP-binding protein [Photobacterium aphoticum]|uniref:Thiamine ABC transporter ATP-binding protein n=2 Tax=Photobacterium aphoticum TaxID=754436 RepID=A0A0J1GH13_9GAMM|nr:thiamine ABC transporter ATP-binding protein [Photobacterium aphoticum]KLU98778.1 thiamine ABC transporter ATP-binding protein [Photobacterium aphoticum]GHA65306.1 thiamine import ATP-binding protein ThiQ [Photobacterium aphoticum]
MLTLSQLRYHYPRPAPHQPETTLCFDLHVNQGDIVALIGPSGAGKSTLLALIAGFLAPASGTLSIAGEIMHQQHPAQRPLSMLFQEHNLFPHLSVHDNIALGRHPGLRLTAQDKADVATAAARVGLSEYLSRLPEQLSGGQRQRVALARCLLRQRPLLLLDEPFSALDPALRKEMLALVQTLAREQHITVLMITHSPDDALAISDQCAFIDDGEIQVFGETHALLTQPTHAGLKRYLGMETSSE